MIEESFHVNFSHVAASLLFAFQQRFLDASLSALQEVKVVICLQSLKADRVACCVQIIGDLVDFTSHAPG